MSFDTASVRPAASSERDGAVEVRPEPTGLIFRNIDLRFLILYAYDLKSFQLIGGPKWIDVDRFDVIARSDSPITTPQRRQMLQALLESRFKLNVRHEKRDLSLYQLVATDKLKLTVSTKKNSSLVVHADGKGLQLVGENTTLQALADRMSSFFLMPVVDQTKISGNFDFSLRWVPDDTQPGALDIWEFVRDPAHQSDPAGPSLFTGLSEQLGLKLKTAKGPTDVIVVLAAAKPTEN